MEEGRHQKDSSLGQKLVDPLPQHWLVEMSVTHRDTEITTTPYVA